MLAHYPFLAPVKEIYWVPVFQNFHFWPGVDIFFAISGYVVTRTILPMRDQSPPNQANALAQFWIRRFFRLIPLAWLTLLASIFLSAFWNELGLFKKPLGNLTDALFQLFYMSNWRAYWCSSNQTDLCGVNTHFWSLSLEEQFYVVLPLLVIMFRRKFWWAFVVLIALQFPLDRPLFSFFWITRVDALLWGVLIAVAEDAGLLNKVRPKFMSNSLVRRLFLTVILLLICWLVAGGYNRYTVGIVGILSAILIWFSSYQSGFLFNRTDTFWRPVAWIGARSYGIYLLHVICFYAVYEFFYRLYGSKEALSDIQALLILIFGLALTLITCHLTHEMIEQPLNVYGRRKAANFHLDSINGRPLDTTKDQEKPISNTAHS